MTGESKKILHVIANLKTGGAERVLINMVNALFDEGYDVGVALLVEGGPLLSLLKPGIKVHHIKRRGRFDLRAIRYFNQIANSYDLIHVHLKHNFRYVFAVNLIAPIKAKILLHDHSSDVLITGVEKTSMPLFIQWLLRKNFYVGVSEALVNWAMEHWKLNVNRSFVLPNAIPSVNTQSLWKRDENTCRLVLAGNFRKIKNIAFALLLVKELNQFHPTTLDIYGYPTEREYYDYIVASIVNMELAGRVNIVSDCNDITPQLYKYDVAIHCSLAETGPLVLMEYMAAGLPFVSFDTGEVVKTVKQSLPQLIRSDWDVIGWVHTIRAVAASRDKLTSELRTIFRYNFSMEKYVARTSAIYGHILKEGN